MARRPKQPAAAPDRASDRSPPHARPLPVRCTGSTGSWNRTAAPGVTWLQIDEPFLAGYRDEVELAIEAVNLVTEDVDVTWGLHVCYGDRYARPSWEGHYDLLFRRCSTRTSISWCWSSPARDTTT